jgi:hypothetical protein
MMNIRKPGFYDSMCALLKAQRLIKQNREVAMTWFHLSPAIFIR